MSQQLPVFYEFGPFCLDPQERVLRRGTEVVLLSPKVVETLLLLVEQAGKVQSKDFLIESLWPDSFVEEGSLTQNISILRKNLGTDENGKQYIETLPKRGYRFAAEVRKNSGFDAPRAEETLTESVSTQDFVPASIEKMELPAAAVELPRPVAQNTTGPKINRPVLIVVFVAILCIAAAVTAFMWERKVTSVSELKTIAILPFKDSRGALNEEYLGMSLADSLITRLGNLRSLSVRPTSAIRKYNDVEIDPVTAGKELAVEAVMEGTVHQNGNKLWITVQLVRVSDGLSLWSEKFESEFTELLTVEDSISSQVARRLTRELSSEDRSKIAKQYTADPEAHRLYLQARYFWNQRTSKGLFRAVELFEEAIKRDPNYALAHAGLADCYYTMGDSTYAYLPPTEAFPKVRIAAQKALDIDEAMAEAHTALGNVQLSYDWNLSGAKRSFERAIELNPHYFQALQGYGWYFIANKQFVEAEQMMLRAREENPVSPIVAADLANSSFFAGEYDKALDISLAALELEPNHVVTHFQLWRVYNQKKEHDKALGEIEWMEKASGRQSLFMVLRGITLAASGKTVAAEKLFNELVTKKAEGDYVPPLLLAAFSAEINRQDEAFKFLDQAITERNDVVFVRVSPEFDRLRSDPRFLDLMRRTGLDP